MSAAESFLLEAPASINCCLFKYCFKQTVYVKGHGFVREELYWFRRSLVIMTEDRQIIYNLHNPFCMNEMCENSCYSHVTCVNVPLVFFPVDENGIESKAFEGKILELDVIAKSSEVPSPKGKRHVGPFNKEYLIEFPVSANTADKRVLVLAAGVLAQRTGFLHRMHITPGDFIGPGLFTLFTCIFGGCI